MTRDFDRQHTVNCKWPEYVGTEVTLHRVTVHPGLQLRRTFCWLRFPPRRGESRHHCPPPATLALPAFRLLSPDGPFLARQLPAPLCPGSSVPPAAELALAQHGSSRCPPEASYPSSALSPRPFLAPQHTRPAVTASTVLQTRTLASWQKPGDVWDTASPPQTGGETPPTPRTQAATPGSSFPPCRNYSCSAQRFITCSCHKLFTRHESRVDEACVRAVFPGIGLPYLQACSCPGWSCCSSNTIHSHASPSPPRSKRGFGHRCLAMRFITPAGTAKLPRQSHGFFLLPFFKKKFHCKRSFQKSAFPLFCQG